MKTIKIKTASNLLTAAITAASVTLPLTVSAQSLEEVIVTATKRAEGLQDVPIALSVVSGDSIDEMGLRDMEDVSLYMPNVTVSQAAGASQIFIRGVGSGNNFGFEQSVGTFIDGVYFGRARNARAAFLDVERVEVLKGPQSTLFGKNTVGGAINITTKRPSDVLEGFVEATYKTEVEGFGITGAVSGPLSDNLRGRLVAKVYEDEGFMENSAPNGDDGPQRDDKVLRGVLEWDASENLSFFLKAEHGEFDVTGRNYKITTSTPTSTFLYGLGDDPNFGDSLGFNQKQSVSSFPGRKDLDENESDIFQLNIDYQMGEHSLRSITAYTEYEFSNCVDADYSSLAFIDRCRDEKHEQFTQEFLLTSPSGGTLEYLVGVYYQDAKLQSDTSTMLDWTAIPPVEGAILDLVGGLPSGSLNSEFFNNFGQDTETWSAFAELTFNITDSFRTTVGLRYSDDSKDASKAQITTAPGTGVSDPFLAFVNGPAGLGFAVEYDYSENRGETHWTGNINLQYDLSDDTMSYLNLSNGYKAGGYDADNAMDRSREFEDEEVTSLELGLKTEIWDNRARINTALFYTEFSDLQVSGFESAGFVVGNAAESEVKGIEVDFVVAVTDSLTLNGAWAYLDAEYKEYDNAACTVDQQVDGSCAANGGFQDLSGTSLQFAPEWSGNLGVSYDATLTDSLDLLMRFDALYSDDTLIAPDGDDNVVQEAYWKYNARIALQGGDGAWSVALVGKNLSDETTFNWGNDATLAGLGFGFESAYFHIIEAPRTFELQARYNF
ncbi:TonB-dependent receptor [Halieaceae bacterium IMCC14734]|uniref:TonB-dependent receptor n=1 Tax=Candidatus Litorirhabdus singularis TaxID=2518993 RepID=A0ABT3TEV5_9GAMM|nr:TonB-dependent receptor [Candidatus Litorirhabdus singularis]MCX2980846.1 TonB-dependent receptor [Candidatus Litorirhabdus singularis]